MPSPHWTNELPMRGPTHRSHNKDALRPRRTLMKISAEPPWMPKLKMIQYDGHKTGARNKETHGRMGRRRSGETPRRHRRCLMLSKNKEHCAERSFAAMPVHKQGLPWTKLRSCLIQTHRRLSGHQCSNGIERCGCASMQSHAGVVLCRCLPCGRFGNLWRTNRQ